MFKRIRDKLSCLDRPPSHSGSNYPPPIFLTYCIHKAIMLHHLCDSLRTDPVQPAWLLWPLCCVPYQNQLILHDGLQENLNHVEG